MLFPDDGSQAPSDLQAELLECQKTPSPIDTKRKWRDHTEAHIDRTNKHEHPSWLASQNKLNLNRQKFCSINCSTTLTRSKKKEASLLPTQWCIRFTTEVIEMYMWRLEYQQNSYLLQPIEEKAERGSVDRGFFFQNSSVKIRGRLSH